MWPVQEPVTITSQHHLTACSLLFFSQLLVLETASIPLRIALVPTCPEQYLLAGCEDGCFAWNIKLDKGQKSR